MMSSFTHTHVVFDLNEFLSPGVRKRNLVTNILQNILFCVQQKKFSFLAELSINIYKSNLIENEILA